MRIDIQIALRSNPLYIRYLSENPIWYKHLNRDPDLFKVFESEVKKEYKLRLSDKVNNVGEQLSLIAEILDILK